MAKGRCRDEPPSTFFPSDGVGVEIARRICAECPVKSPCLEYALRNGIDHGVWGGTSERERRRIARRRRLAAEAILEPTVADHAWQFLTVVDPAHRGHRLGLAVKLANLRYALGHEPALRVIDTWNAAANRHMIAINEALGFRPVDVWSKWQHEFH